MQVYTNLENEKESRRLPKIRDSPSRKLTRQTVKEPTLKHPAHAPVSEREREYVFAQFFRMTQPEIADALERGQSTVSRIVADLREAGQLPEFGREEIVPRKVYVPIGQHDRKYVIEHHTTMSNRKMAVVLRRSKSTIGVIIQDLIDEGLLEKKA